MSEPTSDGPGWGNICRVCFGCKIPWPSLRRCACGTRLVRHKKRGGIYTVIGSAELQMVTDLVDGATLTVYQSDDGKWWARQEDEFEDGRFEEVKETK